MEVDKAQDFAGGDFDLVTCFGCRHDMDDRLEDNLNPIGQLSYSASTMICVPTSLAQETGLALGGSERRLAEVIRSGGFEHVRCATETPLNMVLEVS